MAQIAAPARVAQLIGVEDEDETIALMRLVGAREIASGFGILAQTKPTPWLWSRVGGDAMDLALLTSGLDSPRSDHNRVATATLAVRALPPPICCSTRMTAEPSAPYEARRARDVHATAAVTVQAPLTKSLGSGTASGVCPAS